MPNSKMNEFKKQLAEIAKAQQIESNKYKRSLESEMAANENAAYVAKRQRKKGKVLDENSGQRLDRDEIALRARKKLDNMSADSYKNWRSIMADILAAYMKGIEATSYRIQNIILGLGLNGVSQVANAARWGMDKIDEKANPAVIPSFESSVNLKEGQLQFGKLNFGEKFPKDEQSMEQNAYLSAQFQLAMEGWLKEEKGFTKNEETGQFFNDNEILDEEKLKDLVEEFKDDLQNEFGVQWTRTQKPAPVQEQQPDEEGLQLPRP